MRQSVKLSFTEAEDDALRAAVPKGQTLTDFIRQVLFARAELEVVRNRGRVEGTRYEQEALDKGLKSGRAKPGVFERVRRRHGLPPAKPRTP